ncbi:alpha/beta hydrolase [Archangium sp.]|uniref:alpha/beta hydrolase n=1 Tax=Archangium sp. TaxID=1872627 RepID=UPI002D2B4F88|nr:alpha/beta hydrolase [Archangium sp.]HYO51282.1 alpha/beta hydrolase [Archangium sp.]
MDSLPFLTQACRTAARTALRRVFHGPLRPGWTYVFETLIAVAGNAPPMPDARSTQAFRRFMAKTAPSGPSPRVVTRTRVNAGGVPATWVTPVAGAAGTVILYLHGGAYVVGSAEQYRGFTGRLAVDTGTRLLVPDYRLAPEHPYPAALEDALAAWRWLRSTGVEPSRVVVAGDSAGGGLALALLVALREAGEPLPSGAVLLSPWVDLACEAPSHAENARYDLLTREQLLIWGHFYAGELSLMDPRVSPLYASLRGLPPLYIQAGGVELFRDPILELAERARAAGVPVTLDVREDMPHVPCGFGALTPGGREAYESATAAVRRMVEDAERAAVPAKAAG